GARAAGAAAAGGTAAPAALAYRTGLYGIAREARERGELDVRRGHAGADVDGAARRRGPSVHHARAGATVHDRQRRAEVAANGGAVGLGRVDGRDLRGWPGRAGRTRAA